MCPDCQNFDHAHASSATLLNVKDVAALLNVSVRTVYYWVRRSEIPYIKVGKHLRFETDNVLNYFRENSQKEMPVTACTCGSLTLESLARRWSLKSEARNLADSRGRK